MCSLFLGSLCWVFCLECLKIANFYQSYWLVFHNILFSGEIKIGWTYRTPKYFSYQPRNLHSMQVLNKWDTMKHLDSESYGGKSKKIKSSNTVHCNWKHHWDTWNIFFIRSYLTSFKGRETIRPTQLWCLLTSLMDST